MPMTERFFNTSGPVVPAKHYCVPPLERFDLDEILRLIGAERYFVLDAPRQTGKTSALLALRDLLNGSGEFRCLYVNVEAGQSARGDVEAAMRAILDRLASVSTGCTLAPSVSHTASSRGRNSLIANSQSEFSRCRAR